MKFFKKTVVYRKLIINKGMLTKRCFYQSKQILKSNNGENEKFLTFLVSLATNSVNIEIKRKGFRLQDNCSCRRCDNACKHSENVVTDFDFEVECMIQREDKSEGTKLNPSAWNHDTLLFGFGYDKFDKNENKNLFIELKFSRIIEEIEYEPLSKELQNKECFNNCTIICADNARIKVNSFAFSLFSPIFMNKIEKYNRDHHKIKLNEVDGSTIQELINFIYTGTVTDMKKFAFKLIIAAKVLQFNQLEFYCTSYLSDNLSKENAFSTLKMAKAYGKENLIFQCIEFMAIKFEEIKNSPEYNEVDDVFKKHILRLNKE